jgi:hypothetical protein
MCMGVDDCEVCLRLPLCPLQAILSAQTFPNAAVDAVDVSEPALQVAARNVSDYGLEDRVALRHSDMFAALKSPKVRCAGHFTASVCVGAGFDVNGAVRMVRGGGVLEVEVSPSGRQTIRRDHFQPAICQIQ